MKRESGFDDLVQAIQDAFIKVNNMSETQHLQKISEYFDENHNPKVFTVNYPYFDENGTIHYRELMIPQICLLPMSSLKLDEVAVDFKVHLVGGVRLKKETRGEEKPEEKIMDDYEKEKRRLTSTKKVVSNETFLGYLPQSMGRKSKDENYANIKLKFTSAEAPEGLMRIQDQYTKITL